MTDAAVAPTLPRYMALVAGRWIPVHATDAGDAATRLAAKGMVAERVEPANQGPTQRKPVTTTGGVISESLRSWLAGLRPWSEEELANYDANERAREISWLLDHLRLRQPYDQHDFSSFRLLPGADMAACGRCADWIEANPSAAIYLYGETGRGKTGLAAATLKDWVSRYAQAGRFIVAADWLAELRAAMHASDGFEPLFQETAHVPCLVVDDLGAEKPTEWAVEQLFRLVNERGTRRTTIYTSNYSLSQLLDRLAGTADPILGERIGYRILEQVAHPFTGGAAGDSIIHVKGRNQRAREGA